MDDADCEAERVKFRAGLERRDIKDMLYRCKNRTAVSGKESNLCLLYGQSRDGAA